MDARERRLAVNEVFFRKVNERIESVAEAVFHAQEGTPTVWEFVCECAQRDCSERIPLTLAEYRSVRADRRRFVVAAEHADEAIERIVDRSSRYWVVEKFGAAADIAEADAAS